MRNLTITSPESLLVCIACLYLFAGKGVGPPISAERHIEIIRMSKITPSSPLRWMSDVAKPYQIYVKQGSDVNSSYKQKC
jgi:hypothetical protein